MRLTGWRLAREPCSAILAGMAEKPAPKPEDDTYSAEEVAKRMEATVRAMIGMKPRPRAAKPKTNRKSKDQAE
jgi:hypothetical protein